jgi:hypothetical protein
MLKSRRQFLRFLTLVGGAYASPIVSATSVSGEFTPEMFGAHGDGLTSDGEAFARLISAVNRFSGSEVCNVRCKNKYVITGGPKHTQSFNRPTVTGVIEGILPVTRNNVHIDARGAEFIVSRDFPWRRTMKGGDSFDNFAVGWQFYGANCKLVGGRLLGNLGERHVVRGASPSGFGGSEFGLVMAGTGWELEDVYVEHWGTDCLMIGAPGHSSNGTYAGARRNCVSVVPVVDFGPNGYVSIEGGQVVRGGKWPEQIRNNPGAGIDIEGVDNGLPATARIRDVKFDSNENKDLQISRNALNCVVEGCTFTNNVKFQPNQRGGHFFRNNRFYGEARVETMFGLSSNAPITFDGNTFAVREYPPFHQNVIQSVDRSKQGQKVVFVNNLAPNWRGKFSDVPIFREGNVFKDNKTASN